MNFRFYAKSIILICLAALLCGCQKQEIEPDTESVGSEVPFTLTATYGSPETKLTFDEDGLGTTWQPGDKLYLVDVAGKNKTVTLTTSITAPSKKASFKSTTSVLSGEYVVLYGSDKTSISTSLTITDDEKEISDRLILYGALKVVDGQTSAAISLAHAYAKLTFKFLNMPEGLTDMNMGMAATTDGLNINVAGEISQSGISESTSFSQMRSFGWTGAGIGYLLLNPVNLSSKTIYFYVNGKDANANLTTYEFIKEGIDLKAGHNYNITFDFSKANTKSTLRKSSLTKDAYSLNTPAEFRAAAYWNAKNKYSVESDMDFSNEVYFPIRAAFMYGHKHTLSNINIDLERCNYVGVMSSGAADSLKISNGTIKGHNYVGGVSGSTEVSSYACIAHSVNISGVDYVGGLYGYSNGDVTSCSIIGNSTVEGTGRLDVFNEGVGGLIGVLNGNLKECFTKGTINVQGKGHVGGLVGLFYLKSDLVVSKCYFVGNVSGDEYVGGILGNVYRASYSDHLNVEYSYVKGNVSGGDSYIGGVAGCLTKDSEAKIRNCYVIGDVISKSTKYVAGICGDCSSASIHNCYSYGNVSSGYGICQESCSDDNLTSSPYLYKGVVGNKNNCNCGPDKTFLSLLSVINGDEAYSTQVWKGIDAQCPLLQWQADLLNGDIEAPGFGNEDW